MIFFSFLSLLLIFNFISLLPANTPGNIIHNQRFAAAQSLQSNNETTTQKNSISLFEHPLFIMIHDLNIQNDAFKKIVDTCLKIDKNCFTKSYLQLYSQQLAFPERYCLQILIKKLLDYCDKEIISHPYYNFLYNYPTPFDTTTVVKEIKSFKDFTDNPDHLKFLKMYRLLLKTENTYFTLPIEFNADQYLSEQTEYDSFFDSHNNKPDDLYNSLQPYTLPVTLGVAQYLYSLAQMADFFKKDPKKKIYNAQQLKKDLNDIARQAPIDPTLFRSDLFTVKS